MTVFGIHTNAQGKPLADMVDVWQHADRLGYGWISISDHFAGSIGAESSEAVSAQTAMACVTERARCGVLVYSIGFRHPAVLAGAVTTIDQLSNGRAAIGLGSGSVPKDYEIYGFDYPSTKVRIDMLEEGVQCIAGLLHDDVVNFQGEHFQFNGAKNRPRPVQARLPVYLGTKGEQRGLRIAAKYADAWNITFPSVDEFAHKRKVLHQHCDEVGRDRSDVLCTTNLMIAWGDQLQGIPEFYRPNTLSGSVTEMVDRVGEYVDAGADQVNFFLQHPWDYDGLTELAGALGLSAA